MATGTRDRRRGRLATTGAALGLAAAMGIGWGLVVPALRGGGQEGPAAGPAASATAGAAGRDGATSGREATSTVDEPPSFDQVLEIREELRAAAASSDYPVDAASLAAVQTRPGPYTPLGRIAFPRTGLDAEFGAGVHPSVLEVGPGHWPGTALPGQPGNVVISGHRTTFTRPFADLDLMEPGETILLTPPGGGSAVEYRVTGTTVVPEAEYADFVLRQPSDATARELTLFACHPKGERTHRIVVRASA